MIYQRSIYLLLLSLPSMLSASLTLKRTRDLLKHLITIELP